MTDIEAPIEIRDETDAYDALVDLGIEARQNMDANRWKLGDYTLTLVTYISRYGKRTVEDYADAISVDASRLYEYKGMAEFYPAERRDELSELDLSYTHFREARRLKNLDRAIEFLMAAAQNGWTVTDMRQALKTMRRVDGIDVADTYREGGLTTDVYNRPLEMRRLHPVYDAITRVSRDSTGRVILEDPDIPFPNDIELGRRYRVIFEPIED